MSKTPRTEAFKWRMIDKFGSGTFDEAFPLLIELETELNDAHKAFIVATDQLVQAQSELRQAREENARLRKALADCREDSVELLGERGWWRDEVRCGYQARYMQTARNIQIADVLLDGNDNSPISPKTP